MALCKNSREYDQIANRPRFYSVWTPIVWGFLIIGDIGVAVYLILKLVN